MKKQYWLVKQEPTDYSWAELEGEGVTAWTGVRNFQARNYLRAMRPGDLVVFYHSGKEKAAIGLARVRRANYPDPTAAEGDWCCVDLASVKRLVRPVPLTEIKADPLLRQIPLVRQSRLSVSPLVSDEFHRLLRLGGTRL